MRVCGCFVSGRGGDCHDLWREAGVKEEYVGVLLVVGEEIII